MSQAQMNPHFLFNVLTNIRVKAKMDGNETIYRMLFALGELMRAGIAAGGDSLIPLDRLQGRHGRGRVAQTRRRDGGLRLLRLADGEDGVAVPGGHRDSETLPSDFS